MPKKAQVLIVYMLILSFAVGCVREQMIGRADLPGPAQVAEESTSPDASAPSSTATETTLRPNLPVPPVRRSPEEGLSESEERIWLFVEFLRTMPYETSREVCSLITLIWMDKHSAYQEWSRSAESFRYGDDVWYVLDGHYGIKVEFDFDTLVEFALLDLRDGYSVSAESGNKQGDNVLGISFYIYCLYAVADFVRHMPQPKSDLFKNEFLMADDMDWHCLDSIFEFDEERTYYRSSGMGRYYIMGEGYNIIVFGFSDGEVQYFTISKNYERGTIMSVDLVDLQYIRELLAKGSSDPNEPLPDLERINRLIKEHLYKGRQHY